MPQRTIGIKAVFDVGDFNKGLTDYLSGIRKATSLTTNLPKQLSPAKFAFKEAGQAAAEFGQAVATSVARASRVAAGFRVPTFSIGDPKGAAEAAAGFQLLQDEIRDTVLEAQNLARLSDIATTGLGRRAAELTLSQIEARRAIRANQATQLGVSVSDIDDIRQATIETGDVGSKNVDDESRKLELVKLVSAELAAQNQLAKLQQAAQSGVLSEFEKQTNALEQQKIASESALRQRRSGEIGFEPQFIQQQAFAKINQNTNVSLQQQAKQYSLIAAELQDVLALEQARATSISKIASAAEKERARIAVDAIQNRQKLREKEAREAFLDPAALSAVRGVSGKAVGDVARLQELNLERSVLASLAEEETARNAKALATVGTYEHLVAVQRESALQLERAVAIEQARDKGIDTRGAEVLEKSVTDFGTDMTRAAQEASLVNEEFAAVVQLQALQRVQANAFRSDLDKQTAALREQQILFEQIGRRRAARAGGIAPDALDEAAALAEAQAKNVDARVKEQTRLQLISAELEDQVRLAQAELVIHDKLASVLAKERAEQAKMGVSENRAQRDITAGDTGIDPQELERIRKLTIDAIDPLQVQNTLYRVQQEEIADVIRLHQAQQVLLDRHSTAIQKANAQLQIQQVAASRAARAQQVSAVGADPSKILGPLRNIAVANRDIATSSRTAASGMGDLNAKTIALGVALGQTVVNAVRGVWFAMQGMTSQVFDTIQFFERLNLAVEFYLVRSIQAEDASVGFEEGLARVQNQAQGTVVWLQRLAVSSPFTTRDIATLFRVSQAYGLTRKEAELFTPLLADFAAAAGLQEDVLERLALAIGQIRSRGKLTGEEVRQLGNSGLPIRDILVKELGFANDQFDELVESGALTSDIVIPAIIKALKQFEGQGERVAFQTITGIVSAFAELKEIGAAQFFLGIGEQIGDFFRNLFKIANDQSILQFLKVLGQDVGSLLVTTFEKLQAAIAGTYEAFVSLDPVIKGQIATFVVYAAVIGTVIAATGLLFVALGLLMQPAVAFTVITAAIISEWGAGWVHISALTARAGGFMNKVFAGIANAAIEVTSEIVLTFGEMGATLSKMGSDAAQAYTKGFAELGTGVLSVIAAMVSTISKWLSPHSVPPAFESTIGGGTAIMSNMVLEINGYPMDSLKSRGEELIEHISSGRKKWAKVAGEDILVGMNDGFEEAAIRVGPGQVEFENIIGTSVDDMKGQATDYAIDVSEAFINSFLGGLALPTIKPSDKVLELLAEIGNGPQLSRAGTETFNSYLDGFKQADFDFLGDMSGLLEQQLQAFVDLGEIPESDLGAAIFGGRESIAAAIAEFRETGEIAGDTLDKLDQSTAGMPANIAALAQAYVPLAIATEEQEQLERQLKTTTQEYTKILRPLRQELEAINDARTLISEDREIRELQRAIQNKATGEIRKQEAQLRIDEIIKERQVKAIEREQESVTTRMQDQIDAKAKIAEESQKAFDLVRARADAELAQLQLVAEEAKHMADLQKQLKEEQAKGKTLVELQSELLGLQGEEMADLRKAAKARKDSESAETSELEKQEALLALQEVATNRQIRLQKVRELGFPESELTKLYDTQVLLSDIEKEGKAAFEGLGGDISLDDMLPDTEKLGAEWEAGMAKIRAQWELTKQEIASTAQTINDNLPRFLQFIPKEEGEEPPIIQSIRKYGEAVGYAVGIIVATKAIATLAALTVTINGLITGVGVTGAGGTAVGLTTTAAGLRILAGGIGALAGSLLILAPVIGVLSAITAFGFWSRDAMMGQNEAFNDWFDGPGTPAPIPENMQTWKPDDPLGQMTPGMVHTNDEAVKAQTTALGMTDVAEQSAQEYIDAFINENKKGGFKDIGEGISVDVTAGIQKGITDSLPGSRLTGMEYIHEIELAMRNKAEAKSPSELFAREVGVPIGQGILAGITRAVDANLAKDIRAITNDAIDFLVTNEDSMLNSVELALLGEGGENPYGIGTAFITGIADGLNDEDTWQFSLIPAIVKFAKRFTKEFEAPEAFNTGSPSKLAADRIGKPIAQGIALGVTQNIPMIATAIARSALAPFENRFASRSGLSGGVSSTVNSTRNFNLSVNTPASSQGVIRDFSIMQTMAAG